MQKTAFTSPAKRIRNFFLALCGIMLFVFGFLPFLTRSVPLLQNMADCIEENEIDPSRYFYTDVEQVHEAERYLEEVLHQ